MPNGDSYVGTGTGRGSSFPGEGGAAGEGLGPATAGDGAGGCGVALAESGCGDATAEDEVDGPVRAICGATGAGGTLGDAAALLLSGVAVPGEIAGLDELCAASTAAAGARASATATSSSASPSASSSESSTMARSSARASASGGGAAGLAFDSVRPASAREVSVRGGSETSRRLTLLTGRGRGQQRRAERSRRSSWRIRTLRHSRTLAQSRRALADRRLSVRPRPACGASDRRVRPQSLCSGACRGPPRIIRPVVDVSRPAASCKRAQTPSARCHLQGGRGGGRDGGAHSRAASRVRMARLRRVI